MEFNAENFYITCLMHPSTYLNKILLCSKQGQMQLWNIKTKYVHTYSSITLYIFIALSHKDPNKLWSLIVGKQGVQSCQTTVVLYCLSSKFSLLSISCFN